MKNFNDFTNAKYLTSNDETILGQDLINACRTSAEVFFHRCRKSLPTLDLEDYFLDVFDKALSGLSGFDSRKASLKTWVSKIAWNRLLDFVDSEKRRTSLFSPFTMTDEEGDEYVAPQISGYRGDEFEADRELLTAEAIDTVEKACSKLCESRRLVVELTKEGYKPREIAMITGWTPEKVYGALCWGRSLLVHSLGREFLQENGIAA